ncbi:MAG TPA: tyrosine-type recombinase/integrase [Aromatoleum sp.]|uniref:tyrosine-type recombinase/integrase n=1 Tax=Aromatoleum sp. TaxID=2307007 RepID=UPI002B45B072|nr:tyrosine-type recombinase/integrase [Aromatoleum sp.]HJV25324.1 tyrosine-type recombinase/integrase [Aromatoleum sp.]
MANKFKFTKGAIQALESPPVGIRLTVYDTEVPKLALRVTHAGTRTFYVVKRAGTSMVWVKLGTFPEMTVERARGEAVKLLAEFASGTNPAEARRAFKAELTVSGFFAEYGTRHGEKKRAWCADQQRFRDYLLKPLGAKKLSVVTRDMIARVLLDAEKAGKSVATVRNIRALASGLFAKAVEWGFLDRNPAQGVKVSGKKVSRDRFLQADELPRFFAALAEEPNDTLRDFILLALLTGARRANLCAMHWREIDLRAGVWRIPRTKNDEPQTVTLSPEAVAILETRQPTIGGGFVFPGDSASGHLVEPKKGVMRVMARAGIPYGRDVENGVTLHDLRRTFGSWQARTGASLAIIGKSLNHKSQQATAIYARLDLDPVRAAVNTATAAMWEAGGLKDGAEILPLLIKRSGQ